MKPEYKTLPYRPNISLVVHRAGNFLIMTRINWPDGFWKFPQGGIEDGENMLQAARREFQEELGTDHYSIVGFSKYNNTYDWDDKTIEEKNQTFRGQYQRFAVIEFTGTDADIKPDPQEVKKYRWATRDDVLEYSHDPEHKLFFQYNGTIKKVIEEFSL